MSYDTNELFWNLSFCFLQLINNNSSNSVPNGEESICGSISQILNIRKQKYYIYNYI